MGDALKKVQSGQRLEIPAETYNAFLDAVRAERARRHNIEQDAGNEFRQTGIVKVRNNTGARERFDILGLETPIIDPNVNLPEFKNRPTFATTTPQLPDHQGRFAVLLEPLAADGIGRGIVSGVTICRVWADAEAQEYQFAEAEQGHTDYLRMVESGSAQVLWRESGTGLKWAIVRLGNRDEDQRLIHFELTDELQLGGYAPAKQLEWTGGTWLPGKDITVIDWYTSPSMWQGYAGYRGLALDRPGTENQFDIVWMETPARSIEFQLTQNMGYAGAGQAMAAVTDYYLQGKNPGPLVTVYDAQGNYPRALAGAKGKARWQDRVRRYEIVECNQMAIGLACKLSYKMCSEDSTGTLTGHTVLTFPPYGQTPNPLPATARNYYRLAGRGGDWCLVLWDQDIQDWAIVQVQHHEIEVPIKYRYYEGWLQAKHRKIAVMYCEDETDWRNEIPLVESEFVDELRFTGCGDGGSGSGGGTSPGDSGSGTGCGSIEYHTVKGYFFEAPKPEAWKNVLTFQEQIVLAHAAGSGNCIAFQEVTVCTPCVGPTDSTRVCATVTTTCSCQCNCGDSGGYTSGGSGSCTCSCHATSNINFA